MNKVLIIDGYNVVRGVPRYCSLAAQELSLARDALITDVAGYALGEFDATIVFDATENPASDGEPTSVAGVTVIFSPYGRTADTVIEQLARAARRGGARVEVVTSDAATQWAVLGEGIVRRSSIEFSAELAREDAQWREQTPAGSGSSRIEDRIGPEVRDALSRMARGDRNGS